MDIIYDRYIYIYDIHKKINMMDLRIICDLLNAASNQFIGSFIRKYLNIMNYSEIRKFLLNSGLVVVNDEVYVIVTKRRNFLHFHIKSVVVY